MLGVDIERHVLPDGGAVTQSPCTLAPRQGEECLVLKGSGDVSRHVEINPSATEHGEASGAVHTYAFVVSHHYESNRARRNFN